MRPAAQPFSLTTGTTVGSYVVTGTDNTALKGSSPSRIATVPGAASVAKSTLTGLLGVAPRRWRKQIDHYASQAARRERKRGAMRPRESR